MGAQLKISFPGSPAAMTNSDQLDVNESDICNVQIPLIPCTLASV